MQLKVTKWVRGVLSHVEVVEDKRKRESIRGGKSVNRKMQINMKTRFAMINWNGGLSCMNKRKTKETVLA